VAQQPAAVPDAPSSAVAAVPPATIPHLVKFTGEVRDPAGRPITGPAHLTFALYKDEAGGTPLWWETQTLEGDAQGRYTVLLGAMHAEGLPIEMFTSDQAHWLGVQVDNLPEQPRVLLVSVPYALKAADAETLGGKPASAYLLAASAGGSAPGSTSSATPAVIVGATPELAVPSKGKTRPQSITAGGTANYIAGWHDASNLGTSVIYQDPTTNNIGIATGASTVFSPLEVHAGTDQNLGVEGPVQVGSAVTLNVFNDAHSANVPLEIRASPTVLGMLGNVGIGVLPNPFSKLQVHAGADQNLGVEGPVQVGSAVTLNVFNDPHSANVPLEIRAMPLILGLVGNVGIGTASPAALLEVNGTGKFNGLVSFAGGQTFPGTAALSGGNMFSGNQNVTGNVTASGSVTATSLIGAVPTSDLPLASRTRGITYIAGCDSCGLLQSTDGQRQIYVNLVGNMTLNSVTCFSDAGGPTINIARDNGGPTNLLSSNLTCSTSGASTRSFASSALNLNDQLDFVMVTADGVARRATVIIQATLN
jgi:hypothetical protein